MGEFEEKLNSILSSPKDMERIMGLARELSGNAPSDSGKEAEKVPAGTEAFGALGDFDPKVVSVLSHIMNEYSKQKDDGKSALLNSLKPYLREERKAELDRAASVARIAHIARIAFSEFSGGEFNL